MKKTALCKAAFLASAWLYKLTAYEAIRVKKTALCKAAFLASVVPGCVWQVSRTAVGTLWPQWLMRPQRPRWGRDNGMVNEDA